MGVNMATVHVMEEHGLFGPGRKILDFGSSNLYHAEAEEVVAFVRRYNPSPRADLSAWAERLAAGSQANAEGMALNQSFLGELLETAGMGYDAVDVAIGYKTTVVDLNLRQLPRWMIRAYDTVINCGTSEHILNQFNVFAAVHAATKKGGLMVHNVPSVGHVNHGYFCYTSRFFFDLAGYNKYDILDMWYSGGPAQERLFDAVRRYQTHFPSLTKRLELIGREPRETMIEALDIPTVSIFVLYQKAWNGPFVAGLETSTSVGKIARGTVRRFWR
jgi:hypothetical protein